MILRLLLMTCAATLAMMAEAHGVDEDASTRSPANEQVRNRGAGKDHWWDQLPRPEWSAFERIDQDQDWFEVYRIADGVFAIYEPGQFEEVISFLITGEDRALLGAMTRYPGRRSPPNNHCQQQSSGSRSY